MKLRYLTVLSALAFLLFSCGNNSHEEQNVPETHELLTVAMQDYTMSTEYPASIQGNQDIKIIPRVEGYLQGVYVKEGDAVKAGQLLFRIEDATYRAAVESANANVQMMTAALNRAQLEYDGKKTLRQQEIVSDFELSLAESDLNVAKANLKVAQAQQEQAQIAFEKALLVAGGEVRDALADCQACSTREKARALQVEASRKAYENSRIQMRYAGATYLEVLIAQSTWLDAQLQQTTDWLEKQQSFINLYKATCPE